MNCSRLDKEDIAIVDVYIVQNLVKGVVRYSAAEFILGDTAVKAIDKLSAFFAIHNIPHLGLAVVALVLSGVIIARMNLN